MNKKTLWMGLHRRMLLAFTWEQRLLRLLEEGRTSGFYHAGRGQEAVAAGACAAMTDADYLLYDHRGLGQPIAKGIPLEKIFGDFLGAEIGTTRGLGAGIVHIAWPPLGILGQSGTLGGAFPIAAGAGLSIKIRGGSEVVVCFFGEGASNRGTFQEAANVASLWELPVVWICENNGWAVSVSWEASSAVPNVADRAPAYGMPGIIVDGMDVVAIYDVTQEAIERARTGGGPTLIEAKTSRFRGHYEGDPQPYRVDGELDAARALDPITRHERRMLDEGVATAEEVESLRTEVDRVVEKALAQALASPEVDESRLLEDVLA